MIYASLPAATYSVQPYCTRSGKTIRWLTSPGRRCGDNAGRGESGVRGEISISKGPGAVSLSMSQHHIGFGNDDKDAKRSVAALAGGYYCPAYFKSTEAASGALVFSDIPGLSPKLPRPAGAERERKKRSGVIFEIATAKVRYRGA